MREGRLTPEQAESHPQRAIITRALGDRPRRRRRRLHDRRRARRPTPRVLRRAQRRWCATATSSASPGANRIRNAPPKLLVDAANAAGGEDNITVVVVDVLEIDDATPIDPEALVPSGDEPAPVAGPHRPPPAPDVEPRRSRGRTLRGIVFVLVPLVLLILGVAVGAIGWYARSSYFVGTAGNEVVIYKGVPGGVLGWNPTVDQRTRIAVAELLEVDRERVRGEHRARIARHSRGVRRPRRATRDTIDHHHHVDHDHDTTAAGATAHTADDDDGTAMTLAARRRDRGAAPSCRSACSRDHDRRGLRPRRARRRPDAPARPLRAPRVGVRALPRRAPRGAPVRAARRRDAAAARRAADRHRLRHDRAARPTSRKPALQSLWVAVGVAVFVVTLVPRARRADLRALPVHVPVARS